MWTDKAHGATKVKAPNKHSGIFVILSCSFLAGAILLLLTGCNGYTGTIDPDGGYRSVKKVCYKNKGCVIQDCVTHYTPPESGDTGK